MTNSEVSSSLAGIAAAGVDLPTVLAAAFAAYNDSISSAELAYFLPYVVDPVSSSADWNTIIGELLDGSRATGGQIDIEDKSFRALVALRASIGQNPDGSAKGTPTANDRRAAIVALLGLFRSVRQQWGSARETEITAKYQSLQA